MFQGLRLFKGLCLFRSLEYVLKFNWLNKNFQQNDLQLLNFYILGKHRNTRIIIIGQDLVNMHLCAVQWVLKEFLCNSQLMWLGLLYAWCFALFCSNQKWRLSFLKQPEQHPIEWQARIWFYSSPSDRDEMLPYESQISCSHTIYCLTGDRRRPHLAIGNS